MSDAEREVLWSPAACDGVNVAAADAASVDLDIDIVVAEGFRDELCFFKYAFAVIYLVTYFTFVEGGPCLS